MDQNHTTTSPPASFPASARLTALKDSIAARAGGIAIGEIVDGLDRAGIGMTLLMLSLPALIPIPGPIGLVFGSAIALVGLQLSVGAQNLWLPAVIRARQLPASTVAAGLAKITPALRWMERRLKADRLPALTGTVGRMALALPLILMGVAIALPVPLGNIPPVMSLIMLALGLTLRDGVAVLIGLVLAALAVLWFALLWLFGAQLLNWFWSILG